MIVRATSDLHLSASTARVVWAALAELRKDADKYGGATVIAGDVFDQATMAHVPTWNELRAICRAWPGKLYLIPGNHDQYSGLRSILEGLEDRASGVVVVQAPGFTELGPMIPYIGDQERFWEALESFKTRGAWRAPVLWTHHGFAGSYMNGMKRDTTGLSTARLPPGVLTITGHYHMPQTVGRLIYCGSPYEVSFSEEGQRKGWLRWADFGANPIPDRVLFGDIGAPRHFTVQWAPEQGPPVRPEGLRETDIVRVKTAASKSTAKEAVAQLRKAGLEGAAVLASPDDHEGRGVVGERDGPLEAVDSYIRHKYADVGASELRQWAEEAGLWAV